MILPIAARVAGTRRRQLGSPAPDTTQALEAAFQVNLGLPIAGLRGWKRKTTGDAGLRRRGLCYTDGTSAVSA